MSLETHPCLFGRQNVGERDFSINRADCVSLAEVLLRTVSGKCGSPGDGLDGQQELPGTCCLIQTLSWDATLYGHSCFQEDSRKRSSPQTFAKGSSKTLFVSSLSSSFRSILVN